MSTRTQNILAFASRNLQIGGVAIIITAAYIMLAQPCGLYVLFTPYTGDKLVLGGVLLVVGGITSILGYSIKRWLFRGGRNQ